MATQNNENGSIVITETGVLDSNDPSDNNSILYSKPTENKVSNKYEKTFKSEIDPEVVNSSYTDEKGVFNMVFAGEPDDENVFVLFKNIIEKRFENKIALTRGEPFSSISRAAHPHMRKEKDYQYQKIDINFLGDASERTELLNDNTFNIVHSIFYHSKYDTIIKFDEIFEPLWQFRNYVDTRDLTGITMYDAYNLKNMTEVDRLREGLSFNILFHEFTETFYIQNRYFKDDTTFSKIGDMPLLYRPSHWNALINQANDFKALMTINNHEPVDLGISWMGNGWQLTTFYFKKNAKIVTKRTYRIRVVSSKVVGAGGDIVTTEIPWEQYIIEVENHKKALNTH